MVKLKNGFRGCVAVVLGLGEVTEKDSVKGSVFKDSDFVRYDVKDLRYCP